VMSSDRGLCGGFNSSIARGARKLARDLKGQGKQIKILCIGRKGRDQLRREFPSEIVGTIEDIGKPKLKYAAAEAVAIRILGMFERGEFDVCEIVYNRFKSAMTQIVTVQQLIPFAPAAANENDPAGGAYYEFEPDELEILSSLLPKNLGMQIFKALLENNASEQGARMTAMDSATRNAGDMINKLTITYNRSRQAAITKELIEIISGAEAV